MSQSSSVLLVFLIGLVLYHFSRVADLEEERKTLRPESKALTNSVTELAAYP